MYMEGKDIHVHGWKADPCRPFRCEPRMSLALKESSRFHLTFIESAQGVKGMKGITGLNSSITQLYNYSITTDTSYTILLYFNQALGISLLFMYLHLAIHVCQVPEKSKQDVSN